MPSSSLYVIYYGWLISTPEGAPNAQAHAIAAAQPKALIAFFYTFEPHYPNLSEQVRELLQGSGVALWVYVNTDYGQRALDEVKAEAVEYLSQGVDGIFFDQVHNFLDDTCSEYYQVLYDLVHSYGKTVVLNTGVAECGERIMDVTDVLMVEHDWRAMYRSNSWQARYPATRFMGNSSNEWPPETLFGYTVDCDAGVRDTREAWANGIGWHFSTEQYIELPDWFVRYAHQVGYGAVTAEA